MNKSFKVTKDEKDIEIMVKPMPVLKVHKIKGFIAKSSVNYPDMDEHLRGGLALYDIEESMIKDILSFCYIEKDNEMLYLNDEGVLNTICEANDNLILILLEFFKIQGVFTSPE